MPGLLAYQSRHHSHTFPFMSFPTFWRRAVAEARKRGHCAAAQVKCDRLQAPGSQGAAFRNAGPLGEARTRRSRGARRLGGVEAAFASSRSRSHPPPGSASLFSPHFGTGLRRCRAFSQGEARRGARPAPPAPGRLRRPDAAPDTPPRAVPGRPLVAIAPRLSRLRTGLAEGAPGIGAAAAAPVAVARRPRAPPCYRRRGRDPARDHDGQTFGPFHRILTAENTTEFYVRFTAMELRIMKV